MLCAALLAMKYILREDLSEHLSGGIWAIKGVFREKDGDGIY